MNNPEKLRHPLTPERQAENKALPDNEQSLNDYFAILAKLRERNSVNITELWKHNSRKTFDQHLEMLQCICDGLDASFAKLCKGLQKGDETA